MVFLALGGRTSQPRSETIGELNMTVDLDELKRRPNAYDICKCGDYRHQHVNGTGACVLRELCTPDRCSQFRLSGVAREQSKEQTPVTALSGKAQPWPIGTPSYETLTEENANLQTALAAAEEREAVLGGVLKQGA